MIDRRGVSPLMALTIAMILVTVALFLYMCVRLDAIERQQGDILRRSVEIAERQLSQLSRMSRLEDSLTRVEQGQSPRRDREQVGGSGGGGGGAGP